MLVDTTSPSVASVRGPAAKSYAAGSRLSFTVQFTEPVFATAADPKQLTLPIVIGGTTRNAVWNGKGSGTKRLTFTALPHMDDSAPAGLKTDGPIRMTGGAVIHDRAGNDANPSVSAQFPKAKVNGVGPNARATERFRSQGIDKTKLKGVVVYFQGTTFDKSTVPSNYSVEAQLCASLFAFQGYFMAVSLASKQLGWPLWVPMDHMQALIYEFVYALNIFNTYAAKA